MRELKNKISYQKKKMAFRLLNWEERLADWYERHPVLSFLLGKIEELLWFCAKAWIFITITIWIFFR